jgi:hypothetical protein
MIKEYGAFFEAFKEGKELINSATWKKRQILINHLVAFISAGAVIAQASGYYVPVDEAQITEIVGGGYALVAFVNTILTYVTSAKVGIKK